MPERLTSKELRTGGYDPFFDPVAQQRAMMESLPGANNKPGRERPKPRPRGGKKKRDPTIAELKKKFDARQKDPDLFEYLGHTGIPAVPRGEGFDVPWEQTLGGIVQGRNVTLPFGWLPEQTREQWGGRIPQGRFPVGVNPSMIEDPEARKRMAELYYQGYLERNPDAPLFSTK